MSNPRNLFSKFKAWFATHRTSAALAIVSAALIGALLLVIGGALAGWDIVGALTSRTAILVYVILLLVTIVVVSKLCLKNLK